jgi:2-oxoglutarate dehydrogenase E1 component
LSNYKPPFEIDWSRYSSRKWNENDDTRLPIETLKSLGERITTIPTTSSCHPAVQRIIDNRRQMAQGKLPLDWGMAEHLAFCGASSLKATRSGSPVRTAGADVLPPPCRTARPESREWDQGTYVPLQHVAEKQGDFVVIDSLLSKKP